ncbi:MAG: phage baseplate protein, partial [Acidobacteriota bacterium]|nr:phage baseplate protein [Acidobacteriota bacterium]
MRALDSRELLEVWERARFESPAGRALMLLEAASPEASSDSLANLSIGRRDARLLTLREWTFGSTIVSVADCLKCGERLELE